MYTVEFKYVLNMFLINNQSVQVYELLNNYDFETFDFFSILLYISNIDNKHLWFLI